MRISDWSSDVCSSDLSGELLARQNVQSTQDLQRLTPGVVLTGSGSDFNTTLTIRGQGRDVIGPIAPSVQSYINEVPLPSWGAVIPTYDVANVQVLKGPQGPLFGRNTPGGGLRLGRASCRARGCQYV